MAGWDLQKEKDSVFGQVSVDNHLQLHVHEVIILVIRARVFYHKYMYFKKRVTMTYAQRNGTISCQGTMSCQGTPALRNQIHANPYIVTS